MAIDRWIVHRRISTADTNAVVIRAGRTLVRGSFSLNGNAAVRYVKLYDKATAPAETDTPVITLMLGNNAAPQTPQEFGPIEFKLGFGMRIVTGLADNDNTGVGAGDVIAHLVYRGA